MEHNGGVLLIIQMSTVNMQMINALEVRHMELCMDVRTYSCMYICKHGCVWQVASSRNASRPRVASQRSIVAKP